jgi:hypothetical protein
MPGKYPIVSGEKISNSQSLETRPRNLVEVSPFPKAAEGA